ncbi:MAG: hypothetical protein Q8N03_07215 [Ignavibacteria bacterium]|nr:hypothetical protein [Ignavibacteria bacterium]
MKFSLFNRDKIFNISLFFILISLNFFLLNLPLTKYVSYEFFALNGLFISVLSTLIYLRSIRKEIKYSITINFIFSKSILLLISIPILTALIKLFFGGTCSVNEALQFYLVFTIPTIFVGLTIASFSFYMSSKYSYLISVLILSFFILLPISDFYFFPQVYFFNPLITYFPGTIYDESVEVNQKIILYRLLVTLFSLLIFIFINKYLNRLEKNFILLKISFVFFPIAMLASTYIIFPRIGFSTTSERLINTLNKSIESQRYRIHFDSTFSSTEMEYINKLHKIYYDELKEYFSTEVKGKINSFVFRNSKQKNEFLGTENADVAKPWLKQIYITADSYESTLKHELAHIFAGEFGTFPFNVHPYLNFALIEGIAMAAEDDFAGYQLFDMVGSSKNTDYEMNPFHFFSGANFFVSASSLGYINSGVFVQFIINKFGMDKIKRWYSGERFSKIIHKSPGELDSLFNEYVLSKQKELIPPAALQYYFGRASIFMKECPRYVANRLKEAYKLYSIGVYKQSLLVFEKLSTTTNNPQVLIGRISALSELGLKDSALNLLNNQIDIFKKSGTYYNLLLRKADLLYEIESTNEAIAIYDTLLNLQITPYHTSAIMLRKWLHMNGFLTEYFSSKNENKLGRIFELMKKDFTPDNLLSLINRNEKYQVDIDSVLTHFITSLKSGVQYEQFFKNKILAEQTIKNIIQYYGRRGEYDKGEYLLNQITEPSISFSNFSARFRKLKY